VSAPFTVWESISPALAAGYGLRRSAAVHAPPATRIRCAPRRGSASTNARRGCSSGRPPVSGLHLRQQRLDQSPLLVAGVRGVPAASCHPPRVDHTAGESRRHADPSQTRSKLSPSAMASSYQHGRAATSVLVRLAQAMSSCRRRRAIEQLVSARASDNGRRSPNDADLVPRSTPGHVARSPPAWSGTAGWSAWNLPGR
jgi:hypothetical protein